MLSPVPADVFFGHDGYHDDILAQQLFVNDGSGNFVEDTRSSSTPGYYGGLQGGTEEYMYYSRFDAVAFADYDNDGD